MSIINTLSTRSSSIAKKNVKTTSCIRCGVCLRVCKHNLSPILIKEAYEKDRIDKVNKLKADLCEGCGNCTFVCPARLDLRNVVLRAKVSLRAHS